MKRIYSLFSLFIFIVFSTSTYAQDSLAVDSLVAYYPFDGNALDLSGYENHGEVSGATLTEDRFGNSNSAYEFDGFDYIDFGSSDTVSFDSLDFSISLWAKPVNAGKTQYQILRKGNDFVTDGEARWVLSLDSQGYPRIIFEDAEQGDSSLVILGENSFLDSEWHHFSLVFDRDSLLKLYVDNNLEISSPRIKNYRGKIENSDEYNLYAGRGNSGSSQFMFNGAIDDIKIFNIALTDSLNQELYIESGWPLEDSLVIPKDPLIAFFPFEGDVEDSSETKNHAQSYGGAFTEDRFGNSEGALFLDSDSYVEIPHDSAYETSTKTVSFWFNKQNDFILDNPTGNITEGLVYKGFDTSYKRDFSFSISKMEPDFNLLVRVGYENGELGIIRKDNFVKPNNWYHIVEIIDSTYHKTFINGELVDSVSHPADVVLDNAPILIGKSSVNSLPQRFFYGAIDDLRIYNYAISDSVVQELFIEGGWSPPEEPSKELVAYYSFDGDANDKTGKSNESFVSGASLTEDRFGNPNSAYEFDGFNDYINTNTTFDFQYRTFSIWVRSDNADTSIANFQMILDQDSDFLQYGAVGMDVRKGRFRFKEGITEAIWEQDTDVTEWNHLVMIKDDSTMRGYINGVLINTSLAENSGSTSSPNEFLRIGTTRLFDRHLDGAVDDLRIYNYAISDSLIQELYVEGGWPLPDTLIIPSDTLVAYYPFNGSAFDSSGYYNHGEVFGATLAQDRFERDSSAYSFDGVNDFIRINNPEDFHSQKNLSASFWVKGASSDSSFVGLIAKESMYPFGIAIDDGDRILFSVGSNEVPINLLIEGLVTDPDYWYHYSVVYKSNEYLRLYRNGLEVGSLYGSIPLSIDVDEEHILIGAVSFESDTSFFEGSIDEIRFYNHDLTDEDVLKIYQKESIPPVITSIPEFEQIPEEYTLYQNYPNPFNPSTTIQFDLPRSEKVSLRVYDISGRLISTLIDGEYTSGTHSVVFDAQRLASGIYFYELKTNSFSDIRKFTLIK